MQQSNSREFFTSKFGIFAALTGSAIGIGNLCRFPVLVSQYGGGAFILVYILFIVILCLPVMLSEFVIGRRSESNMIGAFKDLAPYSPWLIIGIICILTAFLISSFYNVVGGWILAYIEQSIAGAFGIESNVVNEHSFHNFITSPSHPLLWCIIFIILTALIVSRGIKKGIERFSKILIPVLFILAVILAVRGLTLDPEMKGVNFLLSADFSKLNGAGIFNALGQALYSLSIGLGCIITYGSYIKKSVNLFKASLWIMAADIIFAILASLIVVPAIFAFNINPYQPVVLIFTAIPEIFMQLPFGSGLAIILFVLLFIAVLTSSIALFEVIVAYCIEQHRFTRIKAVILVSVAITLVGVLAILSKETLSSFSVAGKTIFGLFDYFSSNILLPIIAIFVALFVGWEMKSQDVYDELSNNGSIRIPMFKGFMILLKFIIPITIGAVLLYGIGWLD